MLWSIVSNAALRCIANQQVSKQAVSQVSTMSQVTTSGRTVVITVPRSAAPQPAAPALPQAASPQLPANIQIPPGELQQTNDTSNCLHCWYCLYVHRFNLLHVKPLLLLHLIHSRNANIYWPRDLVNDSVYPRMHFDALQWLASWNNHIGAHCYTFIGEYKLSVESECIFLRAFKSHNSSL